MLSRQERKSIIPRTNRAVDADIKRRVDILRSNHVEMAAFKERINGIKLDNHIRHDHDLIKQNQEAVWTLTPRYRQDQLRKKVKFIFCTDIRVEECHG
jgi:hypothetical protein